MIELIHVFRFVVFLGANGASGRLEPLGTQTFRFYTPVAPWLQEKQKFSITIKEHK